ncbi:MAG: hypothetical protein K8T25_23620 [Planctomycetia bacterium]|nr:hypothetical protein [Planctomycetia bacterium]
MRIEILLSRLVAGALGAGLMVSGAFHLPTTLRAAETVPGLEPAETGKPTPAATATTSAAASPEEIAALVKQLDDDQFARREEASHKLQTAGAAALPGLEKAAQGTSLEMSTRAFAILKKNLTSTDATLASATRATVERLAASKSPDAKSPDEKKPDEHLAAVATRARELLAGPQQVAKNEPFEVAQPFPILRNLPPGVMPGRPMIVRPPVLQIGPGIIANRISVRVTDQTRTIEADQSQPDGSRQQVQIVSDPKAGIKMEVTNSKDGKSDTKKYEAPDAETLKKNHPDAYKIYEQYGQNGGVQGLNILGGQVVIQGKVEIGPGGPAIEEARKNLEEALRNGPDQAMLEQTRRRLEEMKRRLEGIRRPPVQEDPFQRNPNPAGPNQGNIEAPKLEIPKEEGVKLVPLEPERPAKK